MTDAPILAFEHVRISYFGRAGETNVVPDLTRLRELMQKPPFKDNPEAQTFLREAETLIEPQ